jgi:hypothetical protein
LHATKVVQKVLLLRDNAIATEDTITRAKLFPKGINLDKFIKTERR